MKHFLAWLLLLIGLVAAAGGNNAPEGIGRCARCGMDRARFAYSRTLVTYDDGTLEGLCSIHCATEEMIKRQDKKVVSLKVADYCTKNLITAENAIWVTGGRIKGVMTMPAKWAFATEAQARAFVEENGGVLVPFQQIVVDIKAEVEEIEKEPALE